MTTEPNEAAFPHPETETIHGYLGLTKREHFAALAMQGLLASTGTEYPDDHIALMSVIQADALIAALNEENP